MMMSRGKLLSKVILLFIDLLGYDIRDNIFFWNIVFTLVNNWPLG